ncbi:MAG: xanthine dehydrogenase family protein molybdopterin-binding subunit [Alphaproteobacteria bacterium]|nr:xanthine dehydrogenase family protein molybdopterin-binding subunit [Alphaproteobacteria bacterium]MCW5741417.1 xanthine dehydrogenase family protein molybdopterin-binding subunit [Alphaproteobacteria bacterium]
MAKYGIGQPVLRFEDPRLLRGEGRYIHDVNLPGQAYTVLVRSPHAHAKIRSIDVSAARQSPGVVAVYTGADYAADNLGMPRVNMPRKRADGSPMFAPPRPALCVDRVRYVGDPVAMVIADTLAQAKDAAELVEIDYEPLPSSTDTGTTTAPGAPPVYDECPDNVSHIMERGNKAATDAAFAKAARIIRRRYVVTRVHAQYMEPRGALGNFDAQENRMVLYADVQYPHRVRNMLAQSIFKVPEGDMRVIAGDVGGGFGSKGWQYVEHRLTVWAARKLRRPVKWTCERSEAVMADEHGRDNIGDIELALDADNKFIGLRLHMLANIGAYIGSDRNLLTPFGQIGTVVGVYNIPAAYVHITGLLSNTNPTAPYRGAGRPEAIYLIERLVDDAARELGIDRIELRRKNMLPASALPYQSPLGPYYDCGEFEQNLDMALKLADVPGFEARKAQSKKRGMLRGLGIVNAIEQAAGTVQPEYAEVRFTPSGTALLLMGTKAQGQGHETMYKQILNERLGIDPADVKFIDGDTDRVAFGMGTMGSRSTVIGGSALFLAADKVIAKGKRIAAHMLETGEQDIEFADGAFTVAGTDKKVALKQVALAAFQPARMPKGEEMGLYEHATYLSPRDTYPNGCHVCEVEIDPETGHVRLDRYAVVDDVGTVMNPIGLKGQIHGGVAQGVGQILMERVMWDRESGQLYTASFMDYAMPRADTICSMEIKSNPVPTKFNPLGAKGAGEAGTVGAMPVVMNAVMDALSEVGVRELDMPATSDRVWAAIQKVQRA